MTALAVPLEDGGDVLTERWDRRFRDGCGRQQTTCAERKSEMAASQSGTPSRVKQLYEGFRGMGRFLCGGQQRIEVPGVRLV